MPGGLYHVTSRGNRKEDIYLCEEDRETWLEIMGGVCKRFNWICHAYCQMTNHYHAIIETPEGNLSRGMRHLNGVYTQYVNRTHDRVGHLFQGRYKAILVEKESYLLELSRYVVLNPVRAGMVKRPDQWPWSSYRAMVGQDQSPEWLQAEWILGQFGRQRSRARAKFREFVRAGRGAPTIWERLEGQVFLGSARFVERMQRKADDRRDLQEIPRAQRRRAAKPLEYYEKRFRDRKQAMAAAFETGDYTLKAIADHFGVHYSTVSRAVNR
ncbi:MAG: transposase [Gammaproteobacteria bacterium]